MMSVAAHLCVSDRERAQADAGGSAADLLKEEGDGWGVPLTGFLRLSRYPNPAVKVGKKVREREGGRGSLLHAYLRISSVIGARAFLSQVPNKLTFPIH